MVGLALAGCSGDEGSDDGPDASASASPRGLGDRPLVEVVDAGGEARRVLVLAPEPGAATPATLDIAQEVARDDQVTQLPPVEIPFTSESAPAEGEGADATVTTTRTYAEPTIDATGPGAAGAEGLRAALATLGGTVSTLVVRPDGTTVEATSGDPAAAPVDAQVRGLLPVLPGEPVGVGARWTATSLAEVDGALVDQVATYTLVTLEGDDYALDVAVEQTYRPGPAEAVVVRSGRGTLTGRLTGSLARLLPDRADADVTTEVTYVVEGQATEVRTNVDLTLTAG